MIATLLEFVLHLDVHLAELATSMGPWLYVILFLIIFAETGFVVTPFLPGDSLLFATGALAAIPESGLQIWALWILLMTASFAGDNLNYTLGRWIGPKVFSAKIPFLNSDNLRRTQEFYEAHGGKTVFLARFLPILRTFAPFVAGVGHMKRRQFVAFSFVGSICWISLFLGAGSLFGNIPWVKRNFSVLIMALIVISFLPMAYAAVKGKLAASGRGVPGRL